MKKENSIVSMIDFIKMLFWCINMSGSPVDFSVPYDSQKLHEIKRLDDTSYQKLMDWVEKKTMLAKPEYNTFRSIVGVALHIETYRDTEQFSTYIKWLAEIHNILDDKCESIYQHTYYNAVSFLSEIQNLWNGVLFIPRIDEFLFEELDIINEEKISTPFHNIFNFTYSLITEILALYCRHQTVSTNDVNTIAQRLLSTRYYTDVYLFITGYIYERNFYGENDFLFEDIPHGRLKKVFKWDFSLIQERIKPRYYLSHEDRQHFKLYNEYIEAFKNDIESRSGKPFTLDLPLDQEEDRDYNEKRKMLFYIITGKRIVDMYRIESKPLYIS